MKKTVVIIPTFNEKKNMPALVGKISEVAEKIQEWDINVLIVDGNSPDGTGEEVLKLARKFKRLYLLPQKKKRGLGAAYLAGMRKAFDAMKADVVITMDGDLSHNPEDIPTFLDKISQGHDFVIGSRYIKGGQIPENWPIHRKILSTLGNIIVINLLGLRSLTDWTSGFRAIKKEVYDTVVLKIKEDKAEYRGYTFNIGFAYHAVMAGFSVTETPIKFTERTSGKSKLGLEYLLHAPLFLIKTRLNNTAKSILRKITP